MSNRKKKSDQKSESGFSITTITIGVVVIIAVFGWGAMATAYAQSGGKTLDEGIAALGPASGRGLLFLITAFVWFFWNLFVQIPNALDVISYCFRSQPSIPIGILVIEILAITGGFGLKFAEGHLEDPYRKARESREGVRDGVGIGNEPSSPRLKKQKAKRNRPRE